MDNVARSELLHIAAACHRAKWEFADEHGPRAFRVLHRIGDDAKKAYERAIAAEAGGE